MCALSMERSGRFGEVLGALLPTYTVEGRWAVSALNWEPLPSGSGPRLPTDQAIFSGLHSHTEEMGLSNMHENL